MFASILNIWPNKEMVKQTIKNETKTKNVFATNFSMYYINEEKLNSFCSSNVPMYVKLLARSTSMRV